jgi:hypothetical protein
MTRKFMQCTLKVDLLIFCYGLLSLFVVVSSKSRVFFCVHLVVVGSEAPIDTMFRRKYDVKGYINSGECSVNL